ncbi:AP-4 complex subunit mu-like protein [Drosera capensis]
MLICISPRKLGHLIACSCRQEETTQELERSGRQRILGAGEVIGASPKRLESANHYDITVVRALSARRQHRLPRLTAHILCGYKLDFLDSLHQKRLSSQNIDGVNYFHVKMVGLLFVAATRVNVSPSLVLELLQRIVRTTDFKEANRKLEWNLKKIVGGAEHTLRAKLAFSQELHGNITKEAGPVSMLFTIPMYNASRLQVKYLQPIPVDSRASQAPGRGRAAITCLG